jgi:hypothetical protein
MSFISLYITKQPGNKQTYSVLSQLDFIPPQLTLQSRPLIRKMVHTPKGMKLGLVSRNLLLSNIQRFLTKQNPHQLLPSFLKATIKPHLRILDTLLNLRQPPTGLRNLPNLTRHLVLLLLHMRPRQLLLQIIQLLLLLPSLGSFLIPRRSFCVAYPKVREGFFLLRKHFGGLRDVFEAGVVFV